MRTGTLLQKLGAAFIRLAQPDIDGVKTRGSLGGTVRREPIKGFGWQMQDQLLLYFPKRSLIFLLLTLREDDLIDWKINHHLHTAVDDGDEYERHHVPRDLIPHVALRLKRDIALHREIYALRHQPFASVSARWFLPLCSVTAQVWYCRRLR